MQHLTWRRSSVGQSIRFIPEVSLVQIRPPLPHGPLVKRSRHRPFTAKTGVRFPYGSPHGCLAQLGEHMLHTHGVVGSSPIVPTMCGINSVVECHLAKVKVASSNLVSRSNRIAGGFPSAIYIWHHSQVVRQRSAKPLFSSSNLDGASKQAKTSARRSFLPRRVYLCQKSFIGRTVI